jgi:hypothetical protein
MQLFSRLVWPIIAKLLVLDLFLKIIPVPKRGTPKNVIMAWESILKKGDNRLIHPGWRIRLIYLWADGKK